MERSRIPSLWPMPAAYERHLQSAVELFARDERVRALWLTGAVARGAHDAASDLDLCLTVADAHVEEMVASSDEWIREILSPVNIERMGSATGWYVLTRSCERVDFLIESVSGVRGSKQTRRMPVFDRDDLGTSLGPVADEGPEVVAVERVVTEALRQMANFPTVFVRQDWLLGVVAVQQLHYFLYELCAQANRPQPPTGPKQWSCKLASEHRALLESLPVPQPTPESILMAHYRAAMTLEAVGPMLCARIGATWPTELHDAIRTYRTLSYPGEWFRVGESSAEPRQGSAESQSQIGRIGSRAG